MSDSSYLQRAELLADLGRYEDAAAELAEADSDDGPAHTLLARIQLAAGSPQPALAAADMAVAATPTDLSALIARGLALAELGQVDEAASQAEQILRRGRGNGYACTSAAAILASGRVGQVALDAAWEGVRLCPEQPRAHLVLGLVAARLGLAEVAQRAYHEALALDPQLPDATYALGVVRLEQHQYAVALGRFGADDPARADPDRPGYGHPSDRPSSDPRRRGRRRINPDHPAGSGNPGGGMVGGGVPGGGPWGGEPPVDGGGDAAEGYPPGVDPVRRLLHYGAAYAVAAPLLVAWALIADAAAPLVSVLLAGIGAVAMMVGHGRLPMAVQADLPDRLRADRRLTMVVWAVLAVPLLLLLYTLFESGWPLFAAGVAGVVALLANRSRRA